MFESGISGGVGTLFGVVEQPEVVAIACWHVLSDRPGCGAVLWSWIPARFQVYRPGRKCDLSLVISTVCSGADGVATEVGGAVFATSLVCVLFVVLGWGRTV